MGIVNQFGKAQGVNMFWTDSNNDHECLAIGNVHKTSEEAIEWAKKRYNVS